MGDKVSRDSAGRGIGFGAQVLDAADQEAIKADQEDTRLADMWSAFQAYQAQKQDQKPKTNLRPEHSEPMRVDSKPVTPRPMQADPRFSAAAQKAELERLAALFHAGQMDQINYGNLTPASQSLFQDYMQLWQGVPGPLGQPNTMANPNRGPVPAQAPQPILQRRPGRYGTRPL